MRGGWPIVALAEVCTKIQDGAHRSPQTLYPKPGPGRFPYLTSKNIRAGHLKLDTVQYCDAGFHNEIYSRCNPELGDVLLTKDGANTGNVAINTLDEPYSLLSSVCLLKPDPTKLLSRFLLFYIQSKEGFEQITGQMTGTAIKRIILRTIKDSCIPLPPLPEQERIVAILDEAFTAIATATANAEKNLANTRELFECELNRVYSQKGSARLEEWAEVALAEVCTKIQDGAHRSPQTLYSEPGLGRFPYLTSKNIRTGYLKLDTVQYCDADFHDEIYLRCNPKLGDVLLTKDGANTGNVAINTLDEPFSLLSSVCLLKPNPMKLLSRFLFFYIQSKDGFEQITGQMTGAAIKRIILKTIKASRIPLPSLSEQDRIVTRLDIISAKKQLLAGIYAQRLTVLTELKQSIFHKALTGELTSDPKATDRMLNEAGI